MTKAESSSEIVIRIAEGEDLEKLNSFYNGIHNTSRSMEAFTWQFLDPPAGRGFHVIALENNQIIGTQAIMMMTFEKDGQTILTGKSEDTLLHPSSRGKGVFNKMYALLFDECSKRGVQYIWGFTYALKPFQRLDFKTPYQQFSAFSIIKPWSSSKYLQSLDANANMVKKFKVLGFSFFYWLKKRLHNSKGNIQIKEISLESFAENRAKAKLQGLKVDSSYVEWRVHNNPHASSSLSIQATRDGMTLYLCALVFPNGLCRILDYFILSSIEGKEDALDSTCKDLMKKCVDTIVKKFPGVHTIRTWYLEQNKENRFLSSCLNSPTFFKNKNGMHLVWHGASNAISSQDLVISEFWSEGVG